MDCILGVSDDWEEAGLFMSCVTGVAGKYAEYVEDLLDLGVSMTLGGYSSCLGVSCGDLLCTLSIP